MAGITYRNCEFDDPIGAAVDAYRQGVTSRHRSFRARVTANADVVDLGSALSDIDESLDALMKLYGTNRKRFRRAMGLGDSFATTEIAELWILEYLGIALVNGMYVCQHRAGIKLDAYRTIFEVVGLTTMEVDLAVGEVDDYTYYVSYDGMVWSATPPATVAASLGVAVSALDITFVWFESTNRAVRNELRLAGFPRSSLYHIVRGNSNGNVTTVVVPRIDLFTQLRAMAYTTADLTALMERTLIKRVLIDSQQIRDDDSETAITGVYQPTPYPGELARYFNEELDGLPPMGQLRASSGARIYRMPTVTVMIYLDAERSFPTTAYTRRVADEREEVSSQGSQALLAAVDVNTSEVQSSFSAVTERIKNFANGAAETIETAWAFFGVDIDCGRSDPEGWPELGKINPLTVPELFDKISLASDDFGDLFGIGISQMATSNSLLSGLMGAADTLTCGAINLACMADNAERRDGDGLWSTSDGGFDDAGNIAVSMFDAEDVMRTMGNMFSVGSGDFGDFANAMYAAGNLLNDRKEACSQDSSIAQVQGLMDAARGG